MQSNPIPTPVSDTIACNYNAIAPDDRTPHALTGQTLFSSVLAIEELPDGYAFRLPLETAVLHQATDFIAKERLCCPFFSFTLTVNEALWLKLSGTEDVKAFIKLNIVDTLEASGELPDPALWIAAHTTQD